VCVCVCACVCVRVFFFSFSFFGIVRVNKQPNGGQICTDLIF